MFQTFVFAPLRIALAEEKPISDVVRKISVDTYLLIPYASVPIDVQHKILLSFSSKPYYNYTLLPLSAGPCFLRLSTKVWPYLTYNFEVNHAHIELDKVFTLLL